MTACGAALAGQVGQAAECRFARVVSVVGKSDGVQRDAFAFEVAQHFQAAARAIQVDFKSGRLGLGGPGGGIGPTLVGRGIEPTAVGGGTSSNRWLGS